MFVTAAVGRALQVCICFLLSSLRAKLPVKKGGGGGLRREGNVMGWLYTAEGVSVIWAYEFRLLPDSTKFMMTSDCGGSEGKEQ